MGVHLMTSGTARIGEVDLAYDTRGSGEPVLLIAGFGMNREMWDDELCNLIAERGFSVVRMDNRDTGSSTRLDHLGVPDARKKMVRSLLGLSIAAPYTLEDMAADAVGLMTNLGHARFHAVGASMGGMIGQTIALDHPGRLASLTSIMSSPGGRRYAFAKLGAFLALMKPMPSADDARTEHLMNVLRVLSGDGTPFEEARMKAFVTSFVATKPGAAGNARQLAAILDSSGRRRPRLGRIKTPTLVVHGSHDPLVPFRAGKATARAIPGAEFLVIEGMGHWIPSPRYGLVADAVAKLSKRATVSAP